MEKQVKYRKRMLLYSILALTIGIAAIIPLSYITLTIDGTNQTQPFFTPYLQRVQAAPDVATLYNAPGLVYIDEPPNEGWISISICYDITPNGVDLTDVDAKIEVYNFHFYSEQGSILNMTQCVAIAGNVSNPSSPNGVSTAIIDYHGYEDYDNPIDWANHRNTFTFADGTVYDFTELLGYTESCTVAYSSAEYYTEYTGETGTVDAHRSLGCIAVLTESKGEKTAQALTDLRSAQTIYVDITRIMQITYKHPSSSNTSAGIKATPTSNEVLYHMQLPESTRLGIAEYETDHNGYPNPRFGKVMP
ncbi:hypothetical protein [Candidatus Bathycorpusculum sp.]|uniref:hypothetical protein n=1 Tax=Candidatus Bathycorpusculum sp. TaxID=2994959 RepID=UPI00283724A5|nr:hypothetical protein [Candidatus Termitimicrobium sp.]MCL2685166.1 hypothetical protein [Candidatus Termitimicrobium sp.]